MTKSHVDSAALAVAALASVAALMLLPGPFAWMGSIVGFTLLLVLFGFDQEGYRSVLGSLAFAAVCGLCFAVACGAVFRLLAENGEVHLANQQWASKWLPVAFIFGTALLWAIDRSRMSARLPLAERLARSVAGQQSFINYPEPAPTIAAPPARPAPEAPPAPGFSTPASEPYNTYSQPLPPPPADAPPLSPAPVPAANSAPESMLSATTSGAVRPAPVSMIPAGGKETMIYISLLGEGLNVMRSVRAEHLGRDYYKIVDVMPETENWQFQPGQVVRCKKQNLSTGKAMVAVEEAPRVR